MNDHGLPKELLKTVATLLRADNNKQLEQVKSESVKAAEYHAARGAARPRTAEETKLAVEAARAPLQRVNDAAAKVFMASVAEDQSAASANKQQLDKAYGKLGAAKPMNEGKAHTIPKTDKEKKLAALAEPKDKITHADIITGRKASNLTKEEQEFIEMINAVDEAAIDDLKDRLAAKKDAGADKYEFKDKKKDDTKRVIKGRQYNGEKEQDDLEEASYSAKSARAGKDIGKPGKNFAKIAKLAAKKYGSEEAGKRVAGAVLAKLRKEEVEQVDELSRGTLASYTNKAAAKVRTATALHKDFERNADSHLVKAHKAERQGDQETAAKEREQDRINTNISQDFKKDYRKRLDGIAQATKRLAKEEVNTDTPGNSTHQCAIHVKHSSLGEGKTLFSQHAEPDEQGFISWYDVMFEEGIKRVETKDIEILVSESHMNHPKKKKK